jgi:pSer/pThr/pTyr-binding forkhead associated (FHA) protein
MVERSDRGVPSATLQDPSLAAPAVRRLRLLDANGSAVADLAVPRSSLGQHESNDVVLDDPTISRFHCELLLDEAGARVRDLGSRNGTRVNGTRVVEAYLDDGAELQLGRAQLRVRLGEERVAQLIAERTELGPLVGRSAAMRAAFALLERAAATDATVLLEQAASAARTSIGC